LGSAARYRTTFPCGRQVRGNKGSRLVNPTQQSFKRRSASLAFECGRQTRKFERRVAGGKRSGRHGAHTFFGIYEFGSRRRKFQRISGGRITFSESTLPGAQLDCSCDGAREFVSEASALARGGKSDAIGHLARSGNPSASRGTARDLLETREERSSREGPVRCKTTAP